MMKYKGYTAKIEVDIEAGILHGEIADISDVVTFQAESLPELTREFHLSVDDYLEFCEEQGLEAKKPYSGRFVVRIDPELHRTAAVEARLTGLSLNAWVAGAIQDRATHGTVRESSEIYGVIANVLRAQKDPSGVVYSTAPDTTLRRPLVREPPQDWAFLVNSSATQKVN